MKRPKIVWLQERALSNSLQDVNNQCRWSLGPVKRQRDACPGILQPKGCVNSPWTGEAGWQRALGSARVTSRGCPSPSMRWK